MHMCQGWQWNSSSSVSRRQTDRPPCRFSYLVARNRKNYPTTDQLKHHRHTNASYYSAMWERDANSLPCVVTSWMVYVFNVNLKLPHPSVPIASMQHLLPSSPLLHQPSPPFFLLLKRLTHWAPNRCLSVMTSGGAGWLSVMSLSHSVCVSPLMGSH